MISQPKIRNYLRIIDYLKDYYKYRKSLDPLFSFEKWAIELNFSSRSYMRMVCLGERTVTLQFVEKFSKKNHFLRQDKSHLLLLSLHAKAKSEEQKSLLLSKILSSLDPNEHSIEETRYSQFLSSIELPLIQLLLAYDKINATEKKMSELTGYSLEKIRKNLHHLERMGFINKTKNSKNEEIWISKMKSFKVSDSQKNQALSSYHQDNLKEARQFINQGEALKRFRTLMFSCSSENFPVLVEEIENFLSGIKNKYNLPQTKQDKIYKINVQTYPVTKELGLESEN